MRHDLMNIEDFTDLFEDSALAPEETMKQDPDIYPGKRLALRCPWCNEGQQIIRQNRQTDEFFVSCTQWPKCLFSSNLPEDLRLRALGQRSLFDD